MIILSDGRPYDVIINRPNAKNPEPYQGKAAIADTATEVRRLRNLDVSVLGVFAGEEKDLATEKKIFQKYLMGYSIKETADMAFISMNTLKVHNRHIYVKLGVSSIDEINLYVKLLEKSNMLNDVINMLN